MSFTRMNFILLGFTGFLSGLTRLSPVFYGFHWVFPNFSMGRQVEIFGSENLQSWFFTDSLFFFQRVTFFRCLVLFDGSIMVAHHNKSRLRFFSFSFFFFNIFVILFWRTLLQRICHRQRKRLRPGRWLAGRRGHRTGPPPTSVGEHEKVKKKKRNEVNLQQKTNVSENKTETKQQNALAGEPAIPITQRVSGFSSE